MSNLRDAAKDAAEALKKYLTDEQFAEAREIVIALDEALAELEACVDENENN